MTGRIDRNIIANAIYNRQCTLVATCGYSRTLYIIQCIRSVSVHTDLQVNTESYNLWRCITHGVYYTRTKLSGIRIRYCKLKRAWSPQQSNERNRQFHDISILQILFVRCKCVCIHIYGVYSIHSSWHYSAKSLRLSIRDTRYIRFVKSKYMFAISIDRFSCTQISCLPINDALSRSVQTSELHYNKSSSNRIASDLMAYNLFLVGNTVLVPSSHIMFNNYC